MSIKQIIKVPGIDVFFNRNGEETPKQCPHCLSKNIKWSLIKKKEVINNTCVPFIVYKMNCLHCFAEIDFKEEK